MEKDEEKALALASAPDPKPLPEPEFKVLVKLPQAWRDLRSELNQFNPRARADRLRYLASLGLLALKNQGVLFGGGTALKPMEIKSHSQSKNRVSALARSIEQLPGSDGAELKPASHHNKDDDKL